MSVLSQVGRAFVTVAILGLATSHAPAAVTMLVSSVGTNSILQYDGTTGAFIRTFATSSDLDAPFGLTYGPDGNLYVASLGTSRILRYNGVTGAPMPSAGNTGATFIPDTSPSGGLQFPNSLLFATIGGTTSLFVTDFQHDRVLQYNTNGTLVGTFISGGTPAPTRPTGMVFDGTHFFVVSSNVNDTVLEYTTTGALVGNFTHNGNPGKLLIAGAGLAIQGGPLTEGTLWASSFNNTTGELSHVTGYRIYTGSPGNDGKVRIDLPLAADATAAGLNGPAGLAIGSNGDIFVGNTAGNDVLEFNTTTGAFVGKFVTPGSGGLSIPTYLLFTSTAATSAPVPPPGGQQGESAPEPASLVLLGIGTLGLLGYRWRGFKRAA